MNFGLDVAPQQELHEHRCSSKEPGVRPGDAGEQSEAQSEGRAQHAKAGGALFRRGYVGDISAGGRKTGRGDTGNQPPDKQEPKVRRQRHQDIVQPQPKIGQDDHRPAAEPVGQRAQHRLEDELHEGPEETEIADDMRGADGIAVEERLDQLRQHRNDDTERHHIEQDGNEDESERGAAGCRGRGGRCLGGVGHLGSSPLGPGSSAWGFISPSGSSAALTRCIISNSTGLFTSRISSRLKRPMPCSALIEPPR